MSIEAYACNKPGCDGHAVIESADIDFKHIPTDPESGYYAFGDATCNTCGARYIIAPSYVLVDPDGDYDPLDSTCITAVTNTPETEESTCSHNSPARP